MDTYEVKAGQTVVDAGHGSAGIGQSYGYAGIWTADTDCTLRTDETRTIFVYDNAAEAKAHAAKINLEFNAYRKTAE